MAEAGEKIIRGLEEARFYQAAANACAGIPIEFLESVKLQDLLDEDWLEEVISDSLEMDWRPRDAARAILSRLERQHAEALTKEDSNAA